MNVSSHLFVLLIVLLTECVFSFFVLLMCLLIYLYYCTMIFFLYYECVFSFIFVYTVQNMIASTAASDSNERTYASINDICLH